MQAPLFARVPDYVHYWAGIAPHREALVHGHNRITYGALERQVGEVCERLWAAGVRPGDRVAVVSPPLPEFFVSYLAIAALGAIFQGLSPKSTVDELAYVVSDAQPTILLWHGAEEVGQRAGELLNAVDQRLPVFGPAHSDVSAPGSSRSHVDVERARALVRGEDPVAIVYTSGSTGRPKGALLPHRGLAYCCMVQASHWLERAGMRTICNEPINHVGAVGDVCTGLLVGGGTIVFQDRFDAAGVLDLIAEERIEFWSGVPAALLLSAETTAFAAADLSSLRMVAWSGGAAPDWLVRSLRARAPALGTSFGMTETVGSVTYTDPDADDDTLALTIGRASRRFEVIVAREDGSECAIGEQGELRVRSPFTMTSYWRRPEATAETIVAGWLRTGDLAMRLADGNLRLTGRLVEMFKSGGENVYPREVELALESHPDVALAAVVPISSERWGQVGHAFVAVRRAGTTADGINEHVRSRISRFKVPKKFTLMATLPTLPGGKVDKVELRRLASADQVDHG